MDTPTSGNKSLAPFSCSYTPNVPELLSKLNISLAITTYQAGKLVFLSPVGEEKLIQLPRTLKKPMGIGIKDRDTIAIACKDEIITFRNSKELALSYPKAPDTYDALFLPRTTYHTGPLDIHDLEWSDHGIFVVNTLFSCISLVTPDYNFTPYWMPPFITDLVSEDRCHLNGMIMSEGVPAFATAFNKGNQMQSWREEVTTGGILMDVSNSEIVASGLAMPHSPRMFNGKIYMLFSATGELVQVDTDTGKATQVLKIKGFLRGMDKFDDFLFIGRSKLRKNSSTFAKLEIAKDSLTSGITIVHLPTGVIAGEINYQTSVDEIYDIRVFPDKMRPNLLNTITNDHLTALSTPEKTYWGKKIE